MKWQGKIRFPFPSVLAVEDPVEFEGIPDGDASPEEDVQSFNDRCRESCEVDDCFLADPASFPQGFPKEYCLVSVLVGDGFNVECHCRDLDMGTVACKTVVCQIQWQDENNFSCHV
ncbi:MAG: hypothetical protein OXD45_10725 [Rhodobacteraceae bacterium]|nr:hypothetical protein [Paracoccaceae bacterium]